VQRAETLRLKYADLAGTKIASVYHRYPYPLLINLKTKQPEIYYLRICNPFFGFIHWSYFFIPIREKIRNDEIIRASVIMPYSL